MSRENLPAKRNLVEADRPSLRLGGPQRKMKVEAACQNLKKYFHDLEMSLRKADFNGIRTHHAFYYKLILRA
uniref:Transposase n=1 Tax=Steinernema glaseri TaxID=37863 RepID=A0A1I7ZJR8_9BILA